MSDVEMDLYDAMHPRCRAAIADAPYNFNLVGMPKTALAYATGTYGAYEPIRFLKWFEREVEAARRMETTSWE